MKSKKIVFKIAFVVVLFLCTSVLYAQPGGGGGGQGNGGPPPGSTGAPIDGGALFLLAGIVGYAQHQLKGNKMETK